MSVEGVSIERKTTDFIGAGESLRPLRDHIIVKKLPWEPSKVLAVVDLERKPLRGCVTAVGPGCYPWRYNRDRSRRWPSKRFRPTDVKVGDIVNLEGFCLPQIVIDNEVYIIAREEDVVGISHA